ncbi:MAG: acyl carrier protein [Bulleidia sp.]|nr:acyl carrier protein [Bulleidia sp.]
MKEKVVEILSDIRPDVDFETETQLITNGVLESFDILSIVAELSDEFDVTIRPKDLVPENFNSVDAMVEMLKGLGAE